MAKKIFKVCLAKYAWVNVAADDYEEAEDIAEHSCIQNLIKNDGFKHCTPCVKVVDEFPTPLSKIDGDESIITASGVISIRAYKRVNNIK